jgi:hypothetical protein
MVAGEFTQVDELGTLSSRPANTPNLPPQYPYENLFQRQQAKPAQQALQRLWQGNDLAQSLGQKLGTSFVLLRRLQKEQVDCPNRKPCPWLMRCVTWF